MAMWPRIAAMAKFEGITMRREPGTTIPYTRPAQAATIFATETASEDVVDAFHSRVYRAYWEDAKNLGKPEVLQRLMVEAGLDWDAFAPKLESGHYDGTMQQQHDEAMMIGLNGVPSFVIEGKYGVVGAQPIETFVEIIEKVLEERQGEQVVSE
jgi:predicted DsbA family dithiol-disulfide isomerase